VVLSDNLAALSPHRATILQRMLPPMRVAAHPHGPYTDGLPARLERAPILVARFNWDDAPARITHEPPTPSWLADLWTGETWAPTNGPVDLGETPAHGTRLLAVTSPRPHPQVIGSTLTLNGAEVISDTWDNGTLTITLRCAGHHEGELLITTTSGTLRHPVKLQNEATITVTLPATSWTSYAVNEER